MTKAHSGRAHSKLGPSAASRWMVCAGSVMMSEGQDNKSTVFALEGTAAHEFNEFILQTGHDPRDWLGGLVDLEAKGDDLKFLRSGDNIEIDRERYFEIDEEMVDGCELTIETIEQYYSRVDGDELLLETRLDMSWVHPKLFGTGDILIYKRKTKQLVVLDYKYGSGHVVEVADNPQVLTYAVGAAKMFEEQGVDEVISVIIQPRAFHREGPVRSETIDLIDLVVFEGILTERAKATDDPNAELIAGHHCKFCPAAYGCETLRQYGLDLIGVRLKKGKELTERDLPRLQDITPERLGRIVREVKILEGWLKRVMQHAHSEAMEGRVPEGTKLVDKRAYRKWIVSEDDVMCLLDLEGLDEEAYMREPKMLTLTQIEKAIGKKRFAELFGKGPDDPKGMWKKQSSGYVLADIDDDREAVVVSTGGAFGAVEDED